MVFGPEELASLGTLLEKQILGLLPWTVGFKIPDVCHPGRMQ